MRFWDASALVALLVREPASAAVAALLRRDPAVVAWWGSTVECASALARLEREGDLTTAAARRAFERLDALARGWHEIQPLEGIRESAVRLLRVHSLRGADALQLAAAQAASERRPSTLPFVCLDERLQLAASREGFPVVTG